MSQQRSLLLVSALVKVDVERGHHEAHVEVYVLVVDVVGRPIAGTFRCSQSSIVAWCVSRRALLQACVERLPC